MIKKVYFSPGSKSVENLTNPPQLAKKYIPEWYKKLPNNHTVNGLEVASASACIPFLDPFVSGYIYELPCDLTIRYNGFDKNINQDDISYSWYGDIKPIGTRVEDFGTPNVMPNFDGYYSTEVHWNSLWEPVTPKGYSTMYHHPSNRFDLPFHTMTGIIDTDKWSISGPVPFLIKRGFEGTIPMGTPIIQTTFIKRDSWHSSKIDFNEEEYNKKHYSVRRHRRGGYKKEYWEKKEFS